MIKDGNRKYKELKKKLSVDREERLIREAIDDASTDSEGEETRLQMKKSKAASKASASAKGKMAASAASMSDDGKGGGM